MKNKERFAKEIVEFACDGGGIAVDKQSKKPASCISTLCRNCLFYISDAGRCDYKGKRGWAESEYLEKPVISKRDRAFLEYIDKRYEYIVRDKKGQLYVYREKPYKCDRFWTSSVRCFCLNDRINVDFPMVKWEDKEPWSIEDLKKLEVVEEYN